MFVFPRNGQQAAQFPHLNQWINFGKSAASFLYSYIFSLNVKIKVLFFSHHIKNNMSPHFNMYSIVCTLFLTYDHTTYKHGLF